MKTSLDFAEKFPINIEVLIEMKVYDRKDNCKTKLNKNLILDTDFNVQNLAPELSGARNSKAMQAGKNKENIMLTVDCFKSMCMLANSETGKQVKNYYLDLEKIFKEYILRDIKLLTQEKQQAIEDKEQAITEKANITRRLSSVTQNHNKLLKRRRRGVYEIGNVVYIMSHVAYVKSKDLYL